MKIGRGFSAYFFCASIKSLLFEAIGNKKKSETSLFLVGTTRLERATPWSQTKYTTNCTTSRMLS